MSIHTDLDQIFPIKTFLTFSFNTGVTCAVQTVLTFFYYYLFRFCLANFGGLYLFLYSLWLFMGQYQTFLIYLNTFWTTMPYRNIKVLHTIKTDKVTFQEPRSWFSIREARNRYFTCDDDDDDGKIKYFSRGVLDSEKKNWRKPHDGSSLTWTFLCHHAQTFCLVLSLKCIQVQDTDDGRTRFKM